jgi:hypothetical protein
MCKHPTDTNSTGQLSRQTQELIDKIIEVDYMVKIIPWLAKDGHEPLQNNKVPEQKQIFPTPTT